MMKRFGQKWIWIWGLALLLPSLGLAQVASPSLLNTHQWVNPAVVGLEWKVDYLHYGKSQGTQTQNSTESVVEQSFLSFQHRWYGPFMLGQHQSQTNLGSVTYQSLGALGWSGVGWSLAGYQRNQVQSGQTTLVNGGGLALNWYLLSYGYQVEEDAQGNRLTRQGAALTAEEYFRIEYATFADASQNGHRWDVELRFTDVTLGWAEVQTASSYRQIRSLGWEPLGPGWSLLFQVQIEPTNSNLSDLRRAGLGWEY